MFIEDIRLGRPPAECYVLSSTVFYESAANIAPRWGAIAEQTDCYEHSTPLGWLSVR